MGYVCWALGALLVCLGLAAAPRAQGALAVPDAVVVDEVSVAGQTDTSVAFISSVINVPIGIDLERADLENRLSAAQLRLMALGYYRDVALHLERGSARRHYRVVVQVEAYSSFYYGAGLQAFSGQDLLGRNSLSHWYGGGASTFVGDRNWRGTGLWLDSLVSQIGANLSSDIPGFNYRSKLGATFANLNAFVPNIEGGRYFAGLRLHGSYSHSDISLKPDANSSETLRQQLEQQSGQVYSGDLNARAQFGVRLGLFNVSGIGGRSWSRQTSALGLKSREASSEWGGKLGYSEKSYLALVEPGTDVQLTYQRTYGRIVIPNVDLNAAYTWIANRGMALTPGYIRRQWWIDRSTGITHDATLRVEQVWHDAWVFSVEPHGQMDQGTRRRTTFGVGFGARCFGKESLYSLELVLGTTSRIDTDVLTRREPFK